jgi:hypothetical protein
MAQEGKLIWQDVVAKISYVISGGDCLITHPGNDAEEFFAKLPIGEEFELHSETGDVLRLVLIYENPPYNYTARIQRKT